MDILVQKNIFGFYEKIKNYLMNLEYYYYEYYVLKQQIKLIQILLKKILKKYVKLNNFKSTIDIKISEICLNENIDINLNELRFIEIDNELQTENEKNLHDIYIRQNFALNLNEFQNIKRNIKNLKTEIINNKNEFKSYNRMEQLEKLKIKDIYENSKFYFLKAKKNYSNLINYLDNNVKNINIEKDIINKYNENFVNFTFKNINQITLGNLIVSLKSNLNNIYNFIKFYKNTKNKIRIENKELIFIENKLKSYKLNYELSLNPLNFQNVYNDFLKEIKRRKNYFNFFSRLEIDLNQINKDEENIRYNFNRFYKNFIKEDFLNHWNNELVEFNLKINDNLPIFENNDENLINNNAKNIIWDIKNIEIEKLNKLLELNTLKSKEFFPELKNNLNEKLILKLLNENTKLCRLKFKELYEYQYQELIKINNNSINKIEIIQNEKNNLDENFIQLEYNLLDKENEIKELKEKNLELENNFKQINDKCLKINEDLELNKNKLIEKENEINNLKENLKNEEKNKIINIENDKENNNLKIKLNELEEELNLKNYYIDELEIKLNHKIEDIKELEIKIKELNLKKEKEINLINNINNLEIELNDKNQKINNLENELNLKLKNQSNLIDNITNLEIKINDKNQKINNLENELNLKENIVDLEKELKNKEQEINNLKKELNLKLENELNLNKNISDLELIINNIQNEINYLKNELNLKLENELILKENINNLEVELNKKLENSKINNLEIENNLLEDFKLNINNDYSLINITNFVINGFNLALKIEEKLYVPLILNNDYNIYNNFISKKSFDSLDFYNFDNILDISLIDKKKRLSLYKNNNLIIFSPKSLEKMKKEDLNCYYDEILDYLPNEINLIKIDYFKIIEIKTNFMGIK